MVKRHIWELCPESEALSLPSPLKASGFKVNIIALGDVGATLLLGLKLLGGGLIDSIGIYDMNPAAASRYEMEMNQMGWPFEMCGQGDALPVVKIISERDLFDCDMIVFCASKSVPAVGQDQGLSLIHISMKLILFSFQSIGTTDVLMEYPLSTSILS